MRESGEAVIESLRVNPGLKVLDLGCGDGTTALPAARRGADVLGVDIARNLVEAGNRRAQEYGLTNLRFQEGDACNLSELAGDTFDLVVSIFGAMFAPKPFDSTFPLGAASAGYQKAPGLATVTGAPLALHSLLSATPDPTAC